ncbi:hypothetical protein [Longimicrobium sp.]|uniref:hypothetical protein n=1 Tax=Longimicrobium sp. TaxID=2029185 RepID=UPI003B3B16DC
MMYAPEIQLPFEMVPDAGFETRRNVFRLTHALQTTVAEAAIALDLFERAVIYRDATMPSEWWQDEPEVAAMLARVVLPNDRPHSYFSIAPQMHARTFVLALRMIGVFLQTLAVEIGALRPDLDRISQAYDASFPTLKEVRDSIAHMEDRLRGLAGMGKKKKVIIPQPVPTLAPEGGATFSNFIQGRSLVWTLADGSVGSCEVSEDILRTAVSHVAKAVSVLI